jgi:hypothetical protein
VYIIDIFLAGFCLIEFGVICRLFKKYEALFEEIIQFKSPEFILPKYRNEIMTKIQEEKKNEKAQHRSQEYLNLLKTGECSDYDVKEFGVETDG